jgi:selenocysteine-specific elongation factor
MTEESYIIIGTAGHIDHGKTTLVHALTGTFLDTTTEEKQRGITIHLGFTHHVLEHQGARRTLSFIDVPGHENLIQTMIAGASGIDTVLFCVSAVDSVMPQTLEHLQILQFLGIKNGVVAITQADQADDEMIEFVMEDIASITINTFLEEAPVFIFRDLHSYTDMTDPTQPEEIQNILKHLSLTKPRVRDFGKNPFRLYIDRSFSMKGHGTVVTGTISSGHIQVGENIAIEEGVTSKIRNIEVHGSPVDTAFAGQRVALNLNNINVQELSRGTFLQRANSIPCTQMIDIVYHYVDSPLPTGTSVRFLSASFDVVGKIYEYEPLEEDSPLSEDTKTSTKMQYLQIRTQSPVYVLPEDRYILRKVSPQKMLGGGYILDPFPPKCQSRTRKEQIHTLKQIHCIMEDSTDPNEKPNELALSSLYINRHDQKGLSKKKGVLLFSKLDECVLQIDNMYYTDQSLSFYIDTLQLSIAKYHQKNPLRLGVSPNELHSLSLSYISKELFLYVLELGLQHKFWKKEGNRVSHADFKIILSPKDRTEIEILEKNILVKNVEGIARQALPSNKYLDFLIQEDMIIIIDKQIVHIKPLVNCIQKIQMHFQSHTQLQTSEFKEITTLSRKFAIPLLEWLDEQSLTNRQENYRIKGDALFKHPLLNKIG